MLRAPPSEKTQYEPSKIREMSRMPPSEKTVMNHHRFEDNPASGFGEEIGSAIGSPSSNTL